MQKYLKEVFIWVCEFVLKKKILWLFIIGSEYFFEQSCCRKQTIRHELHYNRHPQNSYWGHDGFFLAPKAILGYFYNIFFLIFALFGFESIWFWFMKRYFFFLFLVIDFDFFGTLPNTQNVWRHLADSIRTRDAYTYNVFAGKDCKRQQLTTSTAIS